MSALVRKEIRLLLPAWITAMLLVIAPIPLGLPFEYFDSVTTSYTSTTTKLTIFGLAVGCILLGLAGFGREISSRTFSFALAQPRPRGEHWRAKIGVLLGSLIALCFFLGLVSWQFVPPAERRETALVWFITACVAVTGGLWTTLLFRQIIASFWISVLAPFAILVSVLSLNDDVAEASTRNTLATVLLLTYSVAGYLFARWQFRHAEDTAWTGGNVSLPSARWLPWKRTETVRQKTHPLRALVGKEFQFQQVGFLLAGLLLLVQVAVLLLQKFVNTSERSVLDMIVQSFWVIWIVMPLLVGCSAVAEERKLGTLEPLLCLPVSRAWQFAVKVIVTVICGTVLGALVPVALAFINPTRGTTGLEFGVYWTLACIGLALVSLYASSLTHQLLQALGAAVGIIVAGGFLTNWFAGTFSHGHGDFTLLGLGLWQGPLVMVTGAGVMLLAAMVLTWRRLRWVWISFLILVALSLLLGKMQSLPAAILATESEFFGLKTIVVVTLALALSPAILTLSLAAKNFNHTQTSLSLWWRNSATWLGCFVITGVITAIIYNRVWELAMPFEPPASPPRLSGSVRPVIVGTFINQPTVVLLPDGRLCSYRGYEFIPRPIPQTNSSQTAQSEPVLRAIKNPQVEFIGGSNWVAMATTGREIAGVKSDGSLWSAPWFEQVDQAGNVFPLRTGSPPQKGLKVRATGLKFERLGNESGWAMVAASSQHCVALKRDGTIWGWGDNGNKQLGNGPSSITNGPVQIGQDSNWVAVYAGQGHSYSVNRDGEIWKWGPFTTEMQERNTVTGLWRGNGPVKLNLKVPGVRSITAGQNDFELILDTNGNLSGLGRIPPALGGGGFGTYSEPKRIGGTNWLSVSCSWQGLAGVKADGTLWNQRNRDLYNEPWPTLAQLGKRNDWIAVMSDWGADVALARDGTICRFGEPSFTRIQLLAPTRRVTWRLNLLDAAK